jgi:hypothetical protein
MTPERQAEIARRPRRSGGAATANLVAYAAEVGDAGEVV